MWADMLAADAFDAIQRDTARFGRRFYDSVLSSGFRHDPNVAFQEFRGRSPSFGVDVEEAQAIISRALAGVMG